MQMQFLKISLAIGLVTGASAYADLGDQVVKTRSGDCRATATSRLMGSGLAFSHGSETYVVSSEHVILHDRGSSTCHDVWIGSEWKKSELVRADWATGLALLKLTEAPRQDVSNLPNVAAASDPRVMITGFAAGDRQRIMDRSGRVLARDSSRGLFARSLPIIEIQGAHGEFGMSGAPVFDLGESSWHGILSHQVVVILPGQASATASRGAAGTLSNTLLVIAASAVRDWIEQTLRGSNWASDPHREAAAQARDEEIILYPGLRIRPVGQISLEGLMASARFGGNGVGTGGGDADAFMLERRISVELSPVIEGRELQLSSGLQMARARTATQPSLVVSALECPDSDDPSMMHPCAFDSIVGFIRLLETPGVRIPTPKAKPSPNADLDAVQKAIDSIKELLRAELKTSLVRSHRADELKEASRLVGRLELFVANSVDGRKPQRKWVKETLDDKVWDIAWQTLFDLSFDETLTVQKSLQNELLKN